MQSRHLVQISAECSGIAQRGGLGSVVWGLSDALTHAGHRVTVILPYYEEVRLEVHLFTTLNVRFAGEDIPVSVFQGRHGSLNTLLIHSDRFFRGEYADIYIDSGKLKRGYFEDDAKRFAFFSIAACRLLLHLQADDRMVPLTMFPVERLVHCPMPIRQFMALRLGDLSGKGAEQRGFAGFGRADLKVVVVMAHGGTLAHLRQGLKRKGKTEPGCQASQRLRRL